MFGAVSGHTVDPNDPLFTFTVDTFPFSAGGGCPIGQSVNPNPPYNCIINPGATLPIKNNGQPQVCGIIAGNPINTGTGNKYQTESDYQGAGDFPLIFERTYNSNASTVSVSLGSTSGWRHRYERTIAGSQTSGLVTINRPDGKAFYFGLVYNSKLGASNWQPDADVNLKLAATSSGGWQLTLEDGSLETYNSNGQLLSIKSLSGATHTLTYTNGLLTAVTHSNGRALTLSYDTSNRLATLLDPAGGKYTYSYDANGNLVKVTYPDQTSRVYVYNETANVATPLPHALTGLIDENGNRYATWQYDAQGRAIVSQHNSGSTAVEKVSVSYGVTGSTVTDALNTSRTTNLTTVQGVVKSAGNSQPAGSGCSASASNIGYDANGNTASRTDFNGNTSCYAYDPTRNLELYRLEGLAPGKSCPANLASYTPAANSSERVIATQWHPSFRLPTLITQYGQTLAFSYDANGNLLNKTLTDTASAATPKPTRAWTYTYNSLGQVLTADGPRTDVKDITTYAYYSASAAAVGATHQPGDLQSVTNALGHVTTFTSYDANGRPLSLADPNGLVINLSYDPRGRLIQKTVGGNTTAYVYDAAGNLLKVTPPTGAAISYTYDAAHRLTGISDALGGSIHYTLDAMGNRVQETVQNAAGTLVKSHSRVFDALSRLQQDIGAYNQTVGYQYDANGNVTQITDANRNATQYRYDALDRLTASQDALAGQTNYQYDPLDRLTEVTDAANHNTLYTYNGLGDLVSLTSPNTGLTQYSHDSAGNLAQKTDANNTTASYSYDALDRLTAIAYAGGNASANVVNSYDGAPAGLANQKGRLTASQRGTLANQFSYDLQGNLASFSGWGLPRSVPNANTISYSYNAANQLTDINYSTYRDIHYAYDAAGQINQITVQDIDANKVFSSNGYNLTRTLASNITHLPFGPVNGLTYGNGLTLSKTYGLDYRLTGQTVGAIQNLSYTRDANGNLNTATDHLATANTQTFTYDALDRLISATGPNSFTYIYDAAGNRTTDSKNNAETLYTYDAASQKLLKQTGARPDAILTSPTGNISQSEGKTYGYAPDQRLIATTQGATTLASYNYNPQGQRINKTTTTGTSGYDYTPQGQLLGETGPGLAASYVYLDGEPLARVDYNLSDTTGNVAAWNIAYYHNNPIGAQLKTTDRLGAVSWTGQLDPFGNVLPINPNITQNLRFAGQYYDAESGLIYNNQRWYDPWTGRYLQSDRIGLAGGINTYTYVGNNPINAIDPYGLFEISRNCTQRQKTQIENACPIIKKKADIGGVGKLFSEALDSTTFDCSYPKNLPNSKDECGINNSKGAIYLPNAFNKEECGPLEATIAHEISHSKPFEYREDNAFIFEYGLFGRTPMTPGNFERLYDLLPKDAFDNYRNFYNNIYLW